MEMEKGMYHSIPTLKTKNKVESRLLVDVVISNRMGILELLPSKDKTLLVRRNAFLLLDLGLHCINAVRRLNIKSDSLASESLEEDLHVGMVV